FVVVFRVVVAVGVVFADVDAVRAEVGVGTLVALLVIVADVVEGSEFVAVVAFFGGLDDFVWVDELAAFNEVRGDLEFGEEDGSFFQIDAAGEDGVVDEGDGELDGGGVFGGRELEGEESGVGWLGADGMGFGVVVTKLVAAEGGGPAAESVGLDVAACHEHLCCSFVRVLFWTQSAANKAVSRGWGSCNAMKLKGL